MKGFQATLLVVDDNQDNLFVLRQLIREYLPGCRVLTAGSAKEGLALIPGFPIDCALIDLQMPEMDGITMCGKIKSNPATASLPVILMTAHKISSELKVRGLEAGAEDFVAKPIDNIELVARVKVALRIKRAEDELREMNSRLEDLVSQRTMELLRLTKAIEQVGDGFLLVDSHHVIRYVNPAYESLSGYSRDEIINRSISSIRSRTHDKAFYDGLWSTVSNGATWNGRITVLRKNGSFFEADTIVSPVLDSEDRLSDYVIIMRDVTRMVELEKQVRQMQKMEAIGTLAGGIAHDFNNILSPILGYAEMALDAEPGASQLRRDMEQIMAAGRRAKDLVQQILAFSRQTEQQRRPLRVGSIVKEAMKLLRASIPSSITMQANIAREAEQSTVFADSTQIHQVLMNLCTNARHAMRGQTGVLDVSLDRVDIDEGSAGALKELALGPHLKLSVRDTGHGIDTTVMERIFEPYFTTKAPGEGTGMGLAVVYGIVRSHSGTVTVDSVVGAGTTFDVYLPCTEAPRMAARQDVGPPPTGCEHILLVDDETMLTEMGKRRLTRLGYKVTAFTNVLEALESFRAQPAQFDLVITDFTMPFANGLDFCKDIRHIRPDIPVILCTGFSEEVTPEEARVAGVQEFFLKPLSILDLAQGVRRVLDSEESQRGHRPEPMMNAE
jgi:PAS domain S-box-containing protein